MESLNSPISRLSKLKDLWVDFWERRGFCRLVSHPRAVAPNFEASGGCHVTDESKNGTPFALLERTRQLRNLWKMQGFFCRHHHLTYATR
jgi:hypothetical protein